MNSFSKKESRKIIENLSNSYIGEDKVREPEVSRSNSDEWAAFLKLSDEEQYQVVKDELEKELKLTGGTVFAKVSMVQLTKAYGSKKDVELCMAYEKAYCDIRSSIIKEKLKESN